MPFLRSRDKLGWFDSRQVSDKFKTTLPADLLLSKVFPAWAYEVKRISADLDRFYRMGLLKRRKVKRRVTSKRDGKQFFRGWEYLYWPSNQGWKYTAYLTANPATKAKRHSDRYKYLREMDDTTIFKYALRLGLPSDEAALEILAEDPKKYRLPEYGAYRRFPRIYDRELLLEYIASSIDSKRLMLVNVMMQRKMKRKQARQLKELNEGLDSYTKKESETTGSQFLSRAKAYFTEKKINPMIKVNLKPPGAQIGTAPSGDIPLLDLMSRISSDFYSRGIS